MATITSSTVDDNGNIIINITSNADDAIPLATAGTYSDKNIILNITSPSSSSTVEIATLDEVKEYLAITIPDLTEEGV